MLVAWSRSGLPLALRSRPALTGPPPQMTEKPPSRRMRSTEIVRRRGRLLSCPFVHRHASAAGARLSHSSSCRTAACQRLGGQAITRPSEAGRAQCHHERDGQLAGFANDSLGGVARTSSWLLLGPKPPLSLGRECSTATPAEAEDAENHPGGWCCSRTRGTEGLADGRSRGGSAQAAKPSLAGPEPSSSAGRRVGVSTVRADLI